MSEATGTAPSKIPDGDILLREVRNEWDDDNRCAYPFLYRPGNDGAVERFVKRFKTGTVRILNGQFVPDERPVNFAVDLLTSCVNKHHAEMLQENNCKYLVPIPSHLSGPAAGNLAKAAGCLARSFGLQLLNAALVRNQEIPSSRTSSRGERPSHQLQFRTLSWVFDKPINGGILLFDDVLTTGTTTHAARHKIMEETGLHEQDFVRLFLARVEFRD